MPSELLCLPRDADIPTYRCPECGATIVSLSQYGRCPACAFPLSSKYLAIVPGGSWLEHTADSEQRGAIVRDFRNVLIYHLVWVDKKYAGVKFVAAATLKGAVAKAVA